MFPCNTMKQYEVVKTITMGAQKHHQFINFHTAERVSNKAVRGQVRQISVRQQSTGNRPNISPQSKCIPRIRLDGHTIVQTYLGDMFGLMYKSAKHNFHNLKNHCNTKKVRNYPFLPILLAYMCR